MVALKFLAVFILVALVDFLWAQYIIHTAEARALKSAFYATGIYLLGSLVTIAYVNDHSMVGAAGLGAFAGTYLSVKMKKKA